MKKIIYYNKIIGFVDLYYIDKYISINQLCVHPNYKNEGIITLMLNFISDLYKDIPIILYIDKNKENTDYLFNFYSKRDVKKYHI